MILFAVGGAAVLAVIILLVIALRRLRRDRVRPRHRARWRWPRRRAARRDDDFEYGPAEDVTYFEKFPYVEEIAREPEPAVDHDWGAPDQPTGFLPAPPPVDFAATARLVPATVLPPLQRDGHAWAEDLLLPDSLTPTLAAVTILARMAAGVAGAAEAEAARLRDTLGDSQALRQVRDELDFPDLAGAAFPDWKTGQFTLDIEAMDAEAAAA